jgi:hypothetical protein
MNNVAQTRGKLEALTGAGYTLPALLAVNAFGLFALEQLGAIPTWIKTAAAIFLAF